MKVAMIKRVLLSQRAKRREKTLLLTLPLIQLVAVNITAKMVKGKSTALKIV